MVSAGVRLSQPLLRLPVLRARAAADAVRAEPGLKPGDVGGGTERGVDLHGPGERGPGLAAVAGVRRTPRRPPPAPSRRAAAGWRRHSAPRRRAAGWRRGPAGRGSTARSPAGGGSPIRRRGPRRGPRGPARCPGRRSSWPGGRRRRAGPRSPRVPRCCRRTRRSARPAPPAARRRARGPGCGPAPAGRSPGSRSARRAGRRRRGGGAPRRSRRDGSRSRAAMPRSQQAAMGSFRSSGRTSTSAIASSHRPVSKSSWPRALCAWTSRITVPAWSARCRACRAAAKASSYRSRSPRVTALLICSSSRRSVRAGSAWVTVSARSNSGSASVICACTAVTMVSTCRAQPIAQLSPASDATSSAAAATRPAFSTSPRLLCVRAASTSSRARCRAEIPGEASARSSVARDSANRPTRIRHCASVQCRSTDEIGLDGMRQRAVGHLLGLGRVADPVEGVGEPAHQTVVLGRASRGARDRLAEEFRRHLGRLADQQLGGAGQPAQYPLIHRLGRAARPAHRPQQLPGHPVRRRTGLGERAPGVAVPGGAHRHRYLVVQRRPDQRMPEPEAAAGLGQHAGRAGLVHGRDQVGHAAAQHDRQVRHGEVHAQQGRRPQHLTHRRRKRSRGGRRWPPTASLARNRSSARRLPRR